jgi:hypothetical protein
MACLSQKFAGEFLGQDSRAMPPKQFDFESPFAAIAKFQTGAPVDVEAIARHFGISVYYRDLGPDVAGMLVRDRPNGGASGFAIFVNSKNEANRQRFTLAHEIAHFVLHRDLVGASVTDDAMYRSNLSNAFESQAHRLAADILMPSIIVKTVLQLGLPLGELARRFGVSEQALKIRIDGMRRQA